MVTTAWSIARTIMITIMIAVTTIMTTTITRVKAASRFASWRSRPAVITVPGHADLAARAGSRATRR
jgi:hypothetical protein